MNRPLALAVLAVLLAGPARAGDSYRCHFAGDTEGEALDILIAGADGAWRFEVEDESYPAEPILLSGSTAAHFLVAPVDRPADAVALMSFFEDGKAFLSLHGDFFGGVGQTREGTCAKEGG